MTPMLQQYLEIKEQNKDTILFFRMGDFYEMFFEDAEIGAKALGLTLTSRSHKSEADKIPMCGFPHQMVSSYAGKMTELGYRVALCDQVEDPKESKGLVRREVIRVLSPGVTTDLQMLDAGTDRYACALVVERKKGKGKGTKNTKNEKNTTNLAGLAFVDVSTGRFQITELPFSLENPAALLEIFTRLRPAELLLAQGELDALSKLSDLISKHLGGICLTSRPDFHFRADTARDTLTGHFRTTSLAGFGCESCGVALKAAGALLLYLQETQKAQLSHIRRLSLFNESDALVIDDASRRNLELTETMIGGQRQGSLLSVLDHSATPMGARLLRRWLLFPLQDKQNIEARLDSVEELLQSAESCAAIRGLLAQVADLERLCSRLVMNQGNARDMLAIKNSLARLPDLHVELAQLQSPLLRELAENFDPLADLHELIERSIREDAPVGLREGNLILEGFHPGLDRLIVLLRDGKKMILAMESAERERSGLAKLKVGYNRVFGYYFEVSRNQAQNLPDYYIRKQTLANAERFVTPELKELENSIVSAHDQRLQLEYQLFLEVRERLALQDQRLLASADLLARLDVLVAFAELARRRHYCRPQINEDGHISISEGRHPVIEQNLPTGEFVPNDLCLNQQEQCLLIITGPNMAGKSTVLRQTALIVLMAHLGCFVPAEAADICLVDRIFTRVGAMDDLRRGQSTFMVEMNETANILNNATEKSLVILDEIGRGTSTYDGLSIAWAVAEELAGKNGRGIKTLFATHYHELTDLAAKTNNIQNYSIAVREWNNSIIFLHKLVQGATNRSYGIQVASLAGVPDHVIHRAGEILRDIERGERHHASQQTPAADQGVRGEKNSNSKSNLNAKKIRQLSLFAASAGPLEELIASLKLEEISPKQALDILYEAQQLLADKTQG